VINIFLWNVRASQFLSQSCRSFCCWKEFSWERRWGFFFIYVWITAATSLVSTAYLTVWSFAAAVASAASSVKELCPWLPETDPASLSRQMSPGSFQPPSTQRQLPLQPLYPLWSFSTACSLALSASSIEGETSSIAAAISKILCFKVSDQGCKTGTNLLKTSAWRFRKNMRDCKATH
jgi:hypothetical protein